MSKADAKKKLGFSEDGICVLSCGGSLGSMTINDNILKLLKWYKDNGVQVDHIHSYGTYEGYKDFPDRLRALGIDFENDPHRLVNSYINMPVCYRVKRTGIYRFYYWIHLFSLQNSIFQLFPSGFPEKWYYNIFRKI